MLDFSQVLHVEGFGHLQFSFNCVLLPQKKKYHVSVITGSKNYHFVMVERYGKWKIIDAPQPPDWILRLEESLETLILQNGRHKGHPNCELPHLRKTA